MEKTAVMQSKTYKFTTGCGSIYVVAKLGEDGEVSGVMSKLGKAGGCPSCTTEAICSMATVAIAAGADLGVLVTKLKGMLCHQSNPVAGILSCADAIGQALEKAKDSEG